MLAVPLLGVQALLERARRRELGLAAGRDLDRLAGGRAAPLASGAMTDAELAKPRQRHLTATCQLIGHRVKRGVQRLADLLSSDPDALGHPVSELVLSHGNSLLGSSWFGVDARAG